METRPSRMPISAAVSVSSATARIATPQLLNLKAAKNTAISTTATSTASARLVVMPMPANLSVSPPHG